MTTTNVHNADELCQRGMDLVAAGRADEAAEAFRAAIAADAAHVEAHHGLVRTLRDAGRLEQSVGAALALTALTPGDPLAHTALSISLQTAGHVPEAETAAARARVLEWKVQLESSPEEAGANWTARDREDPVKEPPSNDPPEHDPPVQDPPVQDPPAEDPAQ